MREKKIANAVDRRTNKENNLCVMNYTIICQ